MFHYKIVVFLFRFVVAVVVVVVEITLGKQCIVFISGFSSTCFCDQQRNHSIVKMLQKIHLFKRRITKTRKKGGTATIFFRDFFINFCWFFLGFVIILISFVHIKSGYCCRCHLWFKVLVGDFNYCFAVLQHILIMRNSFQYIRVMHNGVFCNILLF